MKMKIHSEDFTNITNKKCLSATFTVHSFNKDIEWCLSLYPKGDEEECEDYLSIFLKNISTFAVEATVTFFLLDVENEKVPEKKMSKDIFNTAGSGDTVNL